MEAFVQYLIDRELVPPSIAKQLKDRRCIRDPIGMIAVGHGLLTPAQIDVVLDRQRVGRERFGEIAVSLGFLTDQQVDLLIKIQEFRLSSETAEALALSQVLTIEDAAKYLGAFLMRDREVMALVSQD